MFILRDWQDIVEMKDSLCSIEMDEFWGILRCIFGFQQALISIFALVQHAAMPYHDTFKYITNIWLFIPICLFPQFHLKPDMFLDLGCDVAAFPNSLFMRLSTSYWFLWEWDLLWTNRLCCWCCACQIKVVAHMRRKENGRRMEGWSLVNLTPIPGNVNYGGNGLTLVSDGKPTKHPHSPFTDRPSKHIAHKMASTDQNNMSQSNCLSLYNFQDSEWNSTSGNKVIFGSMM